MLLALHGEAGGWDELAIAVVAFGVLWLAVKLAGRKSAEGDDDGEDDESAEELARNKSSAHAPDERPADHAPPTGTTR
jgi:hypothetical protein